MTRPCPDIFARDFLFLFFIRWRFLIKPLAKLVLSLALRAMLIEQLQVPQLPYSMVS